MPAIKGLSKSVRYGPDRWIRLFYQLDEDSYTPFSKEWWKYTRYIIEYEYCRAPVRRYKTYDTQEALEKFYSLIQEFAPKYNLKKLQHEMRKKLIKGI